MAACILLLDENIVAVAKSKNSFFRGGRRLEGKFLLLYPEKCEGSLAPLVLLPPFLSKEAKSLNGSFFVSIPMNLTTFCGNCCKLASVLQTC